MTEQKRPSQTPAEAASVAWWHIHRVAHREAIGVWSYLTCRCGARRTRKRFRGGYSPIVQDWPRPVRGASDSGWRA